eukprot:TRINITY_DN65072_c0_g1_i1.p1 TRINITY_DN65072_c0_g1~~TRINITY_DN65072_c0_g1_i1.p1  ORF type:complete len:345 (-),score=31.83 TRINITY_DN65072_c0_g1_i1:102-1136(-)
MLHKDDWGACEKDETVTETTKDFNGWDQCRSIAAEWVTQPDRCAFAQWDRGSHNPNTGRISLMRSSSKLPCHPRTYGENRKGYTFFWFQQSAHNRQKKNKKTLFMFHGLYADAWHSEWAVRKMRGEEGGEHYQQFNDVFENVVCWSAKEICAPKGEWWGQTLEHKNWGNVASFAWRMTTAVVNTTTQLFGNTGRHDDLFDAALNDAPDVRYCEQQVLLAVEKYIQEHNLEYEQVVLGGISMGGILAHRIALGLQQVPCLSFSLNSYWIAPRDDETFEFPPRMVFLNNSGDPVIRPTLVRRGINSLTKKLEGTTTKLCSWFDDENSHTEKEAMWRQLCDQFSETF